MQKRGFGGQQDASAEKKNICFTTLVTWFWPLKLTKSEVSLWTCRPTCRCLWRKTFILRSFNFYFSAFLIIFILLVSWVIISHCNPGWYRTHHVTQVLNFLPSSSLSSLNSCTEMLFLWCVRGNASWGSSGSWVFCGKWDMYWGLLRWQVCWHSPADAVILGSLTLDGRFHTFESPKPSGDMGWIHLR